jgi:hypothetical protein
VVVLMPPTTDIIDEILKKNPNLDVNEVHSKTWDKMQKYRRKYFKEQVDDFLDQLEISANVKQVVRKALLKPVTIDGVWYESFLVGIGRKMSQSIQPRSGKSAEYCGEIELVRNGLERDIHFAVRDERSDLTLFHPDVETADVIHRVEVKNMKIRERGVRGLSFDGDSLFGFFDQPGEFTIGELKVMEKELAKTGGFVYLPPDTLEIIEEELDKDLSHILRENIRFGSDMSEFVRTGKIPEN